MNVARDSKRPLCLDCQRAEKTCICHWRVNIAAMVEVVILQHPLEQKQVKGSAGLLHLCLSDSQMHVGELFDEAALNAILYSSGKIPVLLYPAFHESDRQICNAPPVLAKESLASPENLRMIVLDGTWRKSRKMLYLNRALQGLPRLSLNDLPASHYLIRKAHRVDQLSTLEASCYALMQLENNPGKYKSVLDAFDGFIHQQMALRDKYRDMQERMPS